MRDRFPSLSSPLSLPCSILLTKDDQNRWQKTKTKQNKKKPTSTPHPKTTPSPKNSKPNQKQNKHPLQNTTTLTTTERTLCLDHNEGSGPEWCISSMLYSWDTPFWSGTLHNISFHFQKQTAPIISTSATTQPPSITICITAATGRLPQCMTQVMLVPDLGHSSEMRKVGCQRRLTRNVLLQMRDRFPSLSSPPLTPLFHPPDKR